MTSGELDKAALSQCQKVLETMVTSLLITKPDDPVPHIIQFIQDQKGVGAPALTREERMELNQLREEYKKLKTKAAAIKKKSTGNVEAAAVAQALSSDSEEE